MRISMTGISILVAGLSLVSGTSTATVHNFTIDGDEAQATTCTAGSTSRIVGTATYDDVTNLVSWSYTFGDNAPAYDDGLLLGGAAALFAHFHGPALPGVVSGNILVNTGTANPNSSSATTTPSLGADLIAGLWYLNVHSTTCPGGELRGQLVPVPSSAVPSASWPMGILLIGGLLAVSALRLRGRGTVAG